MNGKCRECTNTYKRDWRNRNRDKDNERKLKHYYENRELYKDKAVKWKQKNFKRVSLYNQKYRKENQNYFRRYRKENKSKIIIKDQRREARKRFLPEDLTEEQYEEIMEIFGYSCALTGETEDIHMDHVIPLSVGHGGTTKRNIIPLKASINLSKGASNIFEWFEQRGGYYDIDRSKFEKMIEHLAEINGMTEEEYKEYVYFCHENPIEIDYENSQEGSA